MEDIKNEDEIQDEKANDKKIKNLVSAIIILAGLFIGSVFVDVAQMVRGGGFSQRALSKADVFSNNGKTWVSYTDPIVKVKVINDDTCEKCDPSQALVWLKRIVPTMLTEKIDVTTEIGKTAADDLGVKYVPAFIFSKEIEDTEFFAQAQTLFEKKDDGYILNTVELGLPAGKFLESPKVGENDIKVGKEDAKVTIFEFSDFQCPYCKNLNATLKKVLAEYKEDVRLVFKNFPLSFHAQANNAAMAAECANEQGKFEAYGNKLFDSQADWGQTKDTQKFKTYAQQLGLNSIQFNKCMDDKKYEDNIKQDIEEAKGFGISGTPALFIGNEFKNGAVSYDEIKAVIDQALEK